MLDYIILAIVAIVGIVGGIFTLNEARKLKAKRTAQHFADRQSLSEFLCESGVMK